jgi:DNA-binding SARP family transcriptional activator
VVRLALDAGVLVSADRLVDDLWSSGGRSTRRNTLQSKVTMLRRAFGDPSVIESRDGGYALNVEPSDVDAIAALGVVAGASGLLEAGDDRGAADLCTRTLTLYRGEVLASAGEGDWVDSHRVRLEEARTKLLEIQCDARLRLGDVADVIGDLEAAVATYPFQESLWELLITALYRAGRQADALATYQRVKQQLAEELGLDPRPRLQDLEQRILVQDPSLDVASGLPARVDTTRSTGNLPSLTAALVGRATEVAAVSDLLADERLAEIVGPGGIGKTAVAIAVGRRLASSTESVWLARLETAVTADDVVDALVSAVGGPGGEEVLVERFRATSAIVILDY